MISVSDRSEKRTATSATQVEEATAEDLIVALSDRDSGRLLACFLPDARMRALVPSGFQELKGASAIVGRLTSWFAEAESIEVLEKSVYRVSDRAHIRYHFRERYSDGSSEIIEQDAYCDFREGQISSMDLLCSGHRPEQVDEVIAARHFDAGDLGCSSGLPEEFRRQIDVIPIGSNLQIVTRDPSAKEDLPSLARLLGHEVISVKTLDNGNTIVVVKRGH